MTHHVLPVGMLDTFYRADHCATVWGLPFPESINLNEKELHVDLTTPKY